MPQITTKSGRSLDDALNDECHDRDAITRRGDSIVPEIYGDPHRFGDAARGGRMLDAVATDGCKATTETMVPPRFTARQAIDLLRNIDRELALCATLYPPASHHADPHTSAQAAASMAQGAQRHRVAILTALRLFGPATGHELAARLGLEYVQVAKRLTELAADGRINRRETGTIGGKPAYQTRNSPTGRPACVWHINPLAKSA